MTHPEAHFARSNNGDLDVVVRKPGMIRLTGTGAPEDPEGSPRTTFTAECEFGLDNLTVAITMDGFTAGGANENDPTRRRWRRGASDRPGHNYGVPMSVTR